MYSFEDYEIDLKHWYAEDGNQDDFIAQLTDDERCFLETAVSMFDDKTLDRAYHALDWYALKPPKEMLIEILSNNLDLANETFHGGITDTCQREILVWALLQHIKLNKHWPINGDREEYKKEFYTELVKKCQERNIEFSR